MSEESPRIGPDFSGAGPVEYQPAEESPLGSLEQLRARAEARWLSDPGITSVGIGPGPAGGLALTVGVVDAGVATRVPGEVEGVPVVVIVTGPVDALRSD